jgi:hypothetical protein
VEDASACQVSDALEILALQQQEADHVKQLEDVQQMRWHTEGQDLVLKATILAILIEVALVAIQNRQLVRSQLAHLFMRVKMLQPLQTKRVVGPAVLRD